METASFIGEKIWHTLPNDSKDSTSLKSLKNNLKMWIPETVIDYVNIFRERVGLF